MNDELDMAHALRRIMAEVDFYCGVRGAHRTRPDEVSSEQVREAREALKQVLQTEIDRVAHSKP